MSGKRRTKKDKLKASLQREIKVPTSMITGSIPTYTFSQNTRVTIPTVQNPPVIHQSFAYVTHDIKKTFIITSAIAAFNLVLFLLLKNSVLNLDVFGL